MPNFLAAAAVWRHQFDCRLAQVMMTSAFLFKTSWMMNSSLRDLFPPKASPVKSSLLIYICGPPRNWERFPSLYRGVGKEIRLFLGKFPILFFISGKEKAVIFHLSYCLSFYNKNVGLNQSLRQALKQTFYGALYLSLYS